MSTPHHISHHNGREGLRSCASSPQNFDHPDIVLVQAPYWAVEMPPYSLASLSAYARGQGYRVLPLDLNVECYLQRRDRHVNAWEGGGAYRLWDSPEAARAYVSANRELFDRFVDIIVGTGARMVGFSIYFCSAYVSIGLARLLKERDPGLQIIFGGPQAAHYLWPRQLLEAGPVDLLVHGEGEVTLVDVLARARAGESLAGTPGTSVLRDGELIEGPARPMVRKLDELPFADFSDYVFDCYAHPDVLPLATSRGCVNECAFCSEIAFWPRYRGLSGKRIFDEVVHQQQLHPGFTEVAFQDSLINGRLKEIEAFGQLLVAHGLDIKWSGQAIMRKDMTRERLARLRETGCRHLSFGLESGATEVLIQIGKRAMRGTDADQIVRDAHDVGLDCDYNFMFGLPGETERDFQATLDFVRRNKDYLFRVSPSPALCLFTPGTIGHDNPEKFGIRDVGSVSYWEASDGANNWLERLRRFEVFVALIDDLKIPTHYPHRQLDGRERAIADYHRYRQDWQPAAHWYEAAFEIAPDDPLVQARLAECRAMLADAGDRAR